jgi:Trk K+ transport system NAD-binding subunit
MTRILAPSVRQRLVRVAWRWFRFRGLALLGVFLCGFGAMVLGVGVSDRAGLADSSVLVKLYYTGSLFVLGGTDLGTPSTGPTLARGLLWFAYFAAPLITASAVAEAAVRAVTHERWWLRRIRDHVVVAGAGRVGMLLVEHTRMLDSTREIVVVDTRADHPSFDAIRDALGARVLVGDIASDALLASLHLDRASRVALATGDDLANLDAAAKILKRHPELGGRIVVHVSDLGFLRTLAATRLGRETVAFNSHQIAAAHLAKSQIASHFRETTETDCVVLAGFGRFGQSLLDELGRTDELAFDRVIVIDSHIERLVGDFDEGRPPEKRYVRTCLEGDVEDPAIWEKVTAEVGDRHPVVILGTGNDRVNLRVALRVSRKLRRARVIARTFDVTTVGDALAEESGFECFAVSELVAESIPDSWCGD